jgi:hypothetical protein
MFLGYEPIIDEYAVESVPGGSCILFTAQRVPSEAPFIKLVG